MIKMPRTQELLVLGILMVKTIDALIPPIIYIIGNGLFGLKEGVLTRTIE